MVQRLRHTHPLCHPATLSTQRLHRRTLPLTPLRRQPVVHPVLDKRRLYQLGAPPQLLPASAIAVYQQGSEVGLRGGVERWG